MKKKIETIDNICKVHPCVSKISALLLAGCEGQDEAARGKIIEEFCSVPFTKNVVNFMQKGIYTVGFPNISEISPSIKEMITKDMKKDAECLHKSWIKTAQLVLGRYFPSMKDKVHKKGYQKNVQDASHGC